jgi:hypothetical protein
MSYIIKKYKSGYRVIAPNGIALSKSPMSYETARKQQISAFRTLHGGSATGLGHEDYALSDSDINKLLGGTKILRYPELKSLNNIDDAFDSLGRAMILYLTEDANTGHWVCMLKRGGNVIEYFDSYGGYKPDDERKWLSPQQLQQLGQDEPILTKMLHGYTVKSNPYKLQAESSRGEAVNTCGRHCVTRLMLGHLPINKYAELIKSSGINPDDFVTTFTYQMLKK